jgi:hypothetical protein
LEQARRRGESITGVGGNRSGAGVNSDALETELVREFQDRLDEPSAQSSVSRLRHHVDALHVA